MTGGTIADTGISISGNGASYTVTVTGVTGDGTLGLNLNNAGTGIADLAGNAIAGGFTGQVYTIEHTPPSVSSKKQHLRQRPNARQTPLRSPKRKFYSGLQFRRPVTRI